LRCGDSRVRAGASAGLARDVRGMQGCLGCQLAAPLRDSVVVPGLRWHRHVGEERPGSGWGAAEPARGDMRTTGQVQPSAPSPQKVLF
jgi:hypothetical protein